MFICICNAITERQLRSAVADGAHTMSDLQGQLGVGTCCGCCTETASQYLPGGRLVGQPSIERESVACVSAAANEPQLASKDAMLAVAVRRA